MRKGKTDIRVPALRIQQTETGVLYSFAVDGKMLDAFATVSRVSRNGESQVQGYQRPEVVAHIQEIRRYLESHNPLIPNALVVAFDGRVRFEPNRKSPEGFVTTGSLVIPIDDSENPNARPGWIVDGQQRAAAFREARIGTFPVCVTAFITDNVEEQRAQFILVNSTKPLPKGLIHELLPGTEAHLPTALLRRRLPAQLLERLNFCSSEPAPFRGLIRTPTNGDGIIKDNSMLRMIENSLFDGALYRFRDPVAGDGDIQKMLRLLNAYWQAVKIVFPSAWAKNPRYSRLMHGIGIICMGYLMDAISERYADHEIPSIDMYIDDLRLMEPACNWTDGAWDFGDGHERKWNDLQNISRDIQLLANHLLAHYRKRVWRASRWSSERSSSGGFERYIPPAPTS